MSEQTVKIRLTSGNPVFGFAGKLYEAKDDQGSWKDHDVTEELAAILVDGDDARFRRIDENGEVIPNDADKAAAKAKAAEAASRTVKSTAELLGKDAKKDEAPKTEKKAGKTVISTGNKSKKADAPKTAAGKEETPPENDPTTEGAQES